MKPGDEVFVDTNVIIDAFRDRKRGNRWPNSFRLITADQCAVEAATGDREPKDYSGCG